MVIRIFAMLAGSLFAAAAFAQDHDELMQAHDLLVSGAHAEAIAILDPAARAGNARALNLMGAAHEYGLGVTQDAGEALRLYQASADQGYPPAMFNLGMVYSRGAQGIAPDRDRAIEMFERAIGLDYGPAFGSYAALLLETAQSPDDLVRAESLLRRGVERGDPGAIEILAFLRRHGEAGPQDLEEARRLYEVAALMGSVDAQIAVAAMFAAGDGGAPDVRQAFEYFTLAMEAGRAEALHARGRVVMTWNDQFENGAIIGLAECLAGAELMQRDDWSALCHEDAGRFPPGTLDAALREVPAMIRRFDPPEE